MTGLATEGLIFDMLRQGLWISVKISAPLLLVALVAGVAVGLFQALTSIQEMTLTFVPKVGAMLIVFWASMSFMTSTLVTFFTDAIIPLIAGR
ncbi:MAG: flagellar biosynthetic protein FliQ [Cypionkella sp.]|jgi:flagellar biosynthetic protein FliQ|nr:flagellar biosynthetic protein FliQ [Cypionkella sp.]